ncbi:MAG: hypothetical protein WA199_24930, partial [Xanthobacteraceae bacterium]
MQHEAKRSGALQNRDRFKLRVRNDPGPAVHRFALRRIRETGCGMTSFILPLSDPAATNPERVGPKAANLAALARAGLPT